MKLKKGDKIKVMVGKDKGKEGVVEATLDGKLAVAGVNMYKRHSKPKAAGQKGGIVDFSRPLPVSNVSLICPKCKQTTRVGFKITAKEKVRICRKCDQEI